MDYSKLVWDLQKEIAKFYKSKSFFLNLISLFVNVQIFLT